MALPLAAIGLGVGLVGAVGKMFGRKKANKQLESLISQNPSYQKNPIVDQRLGLAQTLLNARMPGAASVERNIYGNQANQLANINRGATDSSQALALAAGTQGQADQAFGNLGEQEAQDYQRRQSNLVGAQGAAVQEGQNVFQDSVRRFGDTVAMRGAQNENRQNSWGDVSNMGFGLMDFGLAGGFNGMFGGGGSQGGQGQGMQRSGINFGGNPQTLPSPQNLYRQQNRPGSAQPNFWNRPQ